MNSMTSSWVSLVIAMGAAGLAACAESADTVSVGEGPSGGAAGAGGTGGVGSIGGLGGAGGVGGGAATCTATFAAGFLESGLSSSDSAIFDHPHGAAAPFVFDPPSGALLPEGWPTPTFLVHTDELPALARLELTVGNQTARITRKPEPAEQAHADSAVSGSWWTIHAPTALWDAAKCAGPAGTTLEVHWNIVYASAGASAPNGATSGTLRLLRNTQAPDVTYWQITDEASNAEFSLQRLAVGAKPQTLVKRNQGECFGCHATSPDGQDFILQTSIGSWKLEVVRPKAGAPAGAPSPVVTPSALSLLGSQSLMVPTTARDKWSDQSGRFVAAVTGPGSATAGRLAVLQVDAPEATLGIGPPATGNSPKDIEEMLVATPALSPDGQRIAYVASDSMIDGYHAPTGWNAGGNADLWQISVTLEKGQKAVFGTPEPVPSASSTPENETFPHWSRDGKLLAFMKSAPGRGGYDEETASIWVMPADGSKPAVAISANAAPGSADQSAPVFHGLGLTNSWPRFGDSAIVTPEGTYYFLLFNSRRGPADLWEARHAGSQPTNGRPIAHLYVSAVSVSNDGTLTTYPAAFLPGQRVDAGAHTGSFTTVTSVAPPPPEVK